MAGMAIPGTNPELDIPVREPAATSADDTILPFQVAALELRGQVVRLGPLVDEILTRHDYPLPVAKLVGEAIVLTVLLGSTLKFEGRFILQTQTDGPVRMLVIDFRSGGKVRACARFDATRVAAAIAAGMADPGALLGKGHLRAKSLAGVITTAKGKTLVFAVFVNDVALPRGATAGTREGRAIGELCEVLQQHTP